MSATLGDVTTLARNLEASTGRPTSVIGGAVRPVPLDYAWSLRPMHETVELLLRDGRRRSTSSIPTQAAAVERAQALLSSGLIDRTQRRELVEAMQGFRFAGGFGKTLAKLLNSGIAVHHAGMLPRYRRLVETLAQRGLLSVICGTDTLGVGINVPIRTVLFTERCRSTTARRHPAAAAHASSTRSPDGQGGPASTPSATWSRRLPIT